MGHHCASPVTDNLDTGSGDLFDGIPQDDGGIIMVQLYRGMRIIHENIIVDNSAEAGFVQYFPLDV